MVDVISYKPLVRLRGEEVAKMSVWACCQIILLKQQRSLVEEVVFHCMVYCSPIEF
jgi:hypothetical protein